MRAYTTMLRIVALALVMAAPARANNPMPHQPADQNAPELVRPALPKEATAEVAGLEAKIVELEKVGLQSETREAQDAALTEAISLAERVLAIRQTHQGNTPQAVRWRDSKGEPNTWYEVIDAAKRLEHLRHVQALSAADRVDLATLIGTDQEVERLNDKGQLAELEVLLERQIKVRQHCFPGDDPDVADTLNNLALAQEGRGRAREAEPLFEQALAMKLRLYTGDHPSVAISLNCLAGVHRTLGRATQAETLLIRALAMRRRLYQGDNTYVAGSLNNLASVRQSLGRAREAEPLYEESLAMHRRLFPGDHRDVALSLNNLARVRETLGRPREAEPLFVESLAMRRRLFPGDHSMVARGLSNLAGVQRALGRAEEAEKGHREALAMYQRLFPADHPDVALSLNNLGLTLQDLGRVGDAEPLYVEAVAMYKRLFPGDHPFTATSLNNVAYALHARGHFGEAEPVYEEALAMDRRLYGGDHPSIATTLGNLATARVNLGRPGEAVPLHQEAISMLKRLYPGDHPEVELGLNNLAEAERANGEIDQAVSHFEESLAMSRRLYPGDHPSIAMSLNNLANALNSLGRFQEAIAHHEEALAMRKRLFSGDHPNVAESMHNLAASKVFIGQVSEAAPLVEASLAMRQRIFSKDHPVVALSMAHLGIIRKAQGRMQESAVLYASALAMAEGFRTQVRGAAQERAAFASELQMPRIAVGYTYLLMNMNRSDEALSILERGRSRAALDMFVGGRGEAERVLRASGDLSRLARYDAAVSEEETARLLVLEAENRMARASEQGKLSELELVGTARRTLSERTAAVFNELRGLVPAGSPLTSEQVLAALGKGKALLSYSWTDEGVIALLARDGQIRGVKLAKDKAESKRLGDAVAALRDAISTRPTTSPTHHTGVLTAARDAVFPESLRSMLDGATAVTVITDGPLAGVPLELLLERVPIAYAPSATIAIDRWRAAQTRTSHPVAAVVVGDPDFGGTLRREPNYPNTGVLMAVVVEGGNAAKAGLRRGDVLLNYAGAPLKQVADLKPAVEAAEKEHMGRGADASAGDRPLKAEVWRQNADGVGETITVSLALGKLGVQLNPNPPAEGLRSMAMLDRSVESQKAGVSAFEQIRLYGGVLNPLPATRLEAGTVASMLGEEAALLLGSQATVPRLREAVLRKPPRVLHLATHGLLGSADRPLLASLALATPKEPTVGDNGFLTLEDILSNWGGSMTGTELVVLSACDTAQGVKRGDTNMALPLGLFVCGAETVVASLWKVDDKATALLMARFYADWLGKTASEREVDGVKYPAGSPMPKLAALREARAWLRQLTAADRDKLNDPAAIANEVTRDPLPRRGELAAAPAADPRPFDHPFYWAAFVLHGSAE